MKCEKCGQEFPSRYYFATEGLCKDCSETGMAGKRPLEDRSLLEVPERVEVKELPLYCPVCGDNEFVVRSGFQGFPTDMKAHICAGCGHVMFFVVRSLLKGED